MVKKQKRLNFLPYNKYHEIEAKKPVYTLMFMGKTKQNTSVIVNGRIMPSKKLIKGYR